jgi:hypothetical protein
LKLKTVTYADKNYDGPIRHVGYIAEDLMELKCPLIQSLIPLNNEGQAMSIHYDRIIPLITPIIKENHEEIKQLKEKTIPVLISTIKENHEQIYQLTDIIISQKKMISTLEDKLNKLLNILNIDYL